MERAESVDTGSAVQEENIQEETANMDIDDCILPKNNLMIAEEKKNAGNDQYKAQNYLAALKLYSDAISLCPETASYYGNRSACFMMIGDYKEAVNDSKKAIYLDDKFEKGYVRMAKCNLLMGDIVGSEQAIKKLLEIYPKSTAVNAEIQNCKLLRELEDKATKALEDNEYRTVVFFMDSAIKIAKSCHRYKLKKAECLVALGRIDEANDIAVTAIQSDPSCADAIYVRGLCLCYTDNLDKSLIHFERALVLDPDHKKAKSMRLKAKSLKEKKEKGNENFKSGKLRDAHKIYTEALAIDELNRDMNSKLYYNRALVNAKLGNIRDAIADCTDALKINSKYLKALLRRARCFYDMESFEECVSDYETALQIEKTMEIKNLLKEAKFALKKSKRKDYYKILGVERNASEDAIKKAYKKRALLHHPDRHANSTEDEKKDHEKKFKEIGEAYAILCDSTKKARYDNGQDIEEDNMADVDATQLFRQFFTYSTNDGGYGNSGSTFNFHF